MKQLVIGFLGCGNIGGGVWKLLQNMKSELASQEELTIIVKKVLVRNRHKVRDCGIPSELLTTDPADVLTDPDIQLVAEFMGGEHPAADYMLQALENGKTVVTANKVALSLNWHALQTAAEKNHVGLFYEASVGGAIPVIATLQNSLQANRLSSIMAIINGTTNYILSRMTNEGKEYLDILGDAQKLGLAEPDPTSDVEGMDAAYKLSIMAGLAFHGPVAYEDIYREGITKISAMDIAFGQDLGYVVKLLAIAKKEDNMVEVRVHPTFLPKAHPLAMVNGSFNAVYLQGHACKEMMLQGRGAGDMPTASAIVSDIINASHTDNFRYPAFDCLPAAKKDLSFTNNWSTRYYIRISAADRVGVLSKVAGCFAEEGVSIASMIQRGQMDGERVPLIFITHKADEQAVQRAMARLDTERCRVEAMIRVED